MKKQLLSGIAIGLILAMMPTVVLGQTSGTNTAVQDYMKAQADYNAAQQELQDAKDDIYWSTSNREAAESAAQAKVDAAAKALDTAKTATGMDDYTLKNAVKVETAKNAVTQAKANEQAAKDDWYVLTSRTEAEKKAADNTKAAEANLAKVEQQTAKSNQLKANADAAAAATTESAAAEREKAIREKVNAEYEAKANKQKKEEAARKAQQEADQKSKKDAQDALDKAAKEAQADYDAGNYANNIEKIMQDQKSLSEKEEALAKAREELQEAKDGTYLTTSRRQKAESAAQAKVDAAERALNEAKTSWVLENDEEAMSAQFTADAICANEGSFSMNCQQAKQQVDEYISNAKQRMQNKIEELKTEQAQKASAVSKAEAQANMRKGAFWDALVTVDITKGDNYIDTQYDGIYQRAFNDTSTYAKGLAGAAASMLKTAQGNLTDKQNALTNATNKANAQKNAANSELASQLDKQLLAQENKVAAAEGAVSEAQKAYDNAKTPEEKAAAEAKLNQAQADLTDAQLSRDEFEEYANLQKQQNQAQEEKRAADKNLATAEEAYKAADSTPCDSEDLACKQNKADAKAVYQEALNKRNAAEKNLKKVSDDTEDARAMAELGLTKDEINALNSNLKKQKDAVKAANSQIDDAQKVVDNAQKNVDNAQKQKDIMDKVAAGTVTQEEADQAMKGFAKEQKIQSEIKAAEQRALFEQQEAQKALKRQEQQEARAAEQKAQQDARAAAAERQKLLSGALLTETIRENVSDPITSATKSVTDYISGGIKDVQTGVGDALYDTYKSITK